MVVERPMLETVWDWLSAVPDPEIPVISLMDLGIIRDVVWNDDTLEVTVTPTYSGCPATSIINLDIETALRAKGIEKVVLKRQLSPAWTTDWLSDAGRAKLEAYGIAPPQPAGGPQHCPHCNPSRWKRSASLDLPPARRSGAARIAWNPLTISSASKEGSVSNFDSPILMIVATGIGPACAIFAF